MKNNDQTEPTIIHCNSDYTLIQDCINSMLEKITEVIAEIADATIEQALENFFIIACADGAEHKGLGEVNNIGSCFLVEQCEVHPTS